MSTTPNSAGALLVACLCADWCSTCRDYAAVFESVERQFEARAQFVWVDVEDDDEALGALDVQDFPTLLIARGEQIVFFGPVMPHERTAVALIERALVGELADVKDAALAGVAGRVRALAGR